MDKVKLPREVIDSLDNIHRNSITPTMLIRDCIRSDYFKNTTDEDFKRVGELDLDTLIRALYIGYEVEQTPEERIKRIYDRSVIEHGEIGCQLDEYTTKILIREMLNIIGIKIEGVNA